MDKRRYLSSVPADIELCVPRHTLVPGKLNGEDDNVLVDRLRRKFFRRRSDWYIEDLCRIVVASRLPAEGSMDDVIGLLDTILAGWRRWV